MPLLLYRYERPATIMCECPRMLSASASAAALALAIALAVVIAPAIAPAMATTEHPTSESATLGVTKQLMPRRAHR